MCWLQGTGAEWQEEQEESLSEQLESNTHTLPSNPAVPSNLTQNIIYLWWQRPEVRGLELTRSDWNKSLKANNYTDSLLCHRCNLVRIRSFNNKNTKCSSHTRGWWNKVPGRSPPENGKIKYFFPAAWIILPGKCPEERPPRCLPCIHRRQSHYTGSSEDHWGLKSIKFKILFLVCEN